MTRVQAAIFRSELSAEAAQSSRSPAEHTTGDVWTTSHARAKARRPVRRRSRAVGAGVHRPAGGFAPSWAPSVDIARRRGTGTIPLTPQSNHITRPDR